LNAWKWCLSTLFCSAPAGWNLPRGAAYALIAITTMPSVPLDDELLAVLSVGLPIGLGLYWRPAQPPPELDSNLRYYIHDRIHNGRLTRGRIPADIVYGARKMEPK
jgi:hypothetical protein